MHRLKSPTGLFCLKRNPNYENMIKLFDYGVLSKCTWYLKIVLTDAITKKQSCI